MDYTNPSDSGLLRSQWANPNQILSLLLLVGGDIIQTAIAQFVGVRPLKWAEDISLTPVAFSFGWVAYAFLSMMAVIGDNRLMPAIPDCPSLVINCDNGYTRINHSWVLGRILRDHESRNPPMQSSDGKNYSIRIDIFNVTSGPRETPELDWQWKFGWAVILTQQFVAFVPWVMYGDWAIFLVTVAGTLLALITSGLPQWSKEKWSTRPLKNPKTVCLTRGNGHHHVMVFICLQGAWDFEAMASAAPAESRLTRVFLVLLAMGWTAILITVFALIHNAWFLFAIGGLGLLQNLHAAGATRNAGAFNVYLTPYKTRTIMGYPKGEQEPGDNDNSDEEMERPDLESAVPAQRPIRYSEDKTEGEAVAGALMALEIELPKVGASLAAEFFPGRLEYSPGRYKYNWEKKFWKKAFRRFRRPVNP